jgi:hypothetical protein
MATSAFEMWDLIGNKLPMVALALGESERAQIVHAHMRFAGKQFFDDVPGVTPTDALDFFALVFQPNILLRCKYVGRGPQNYPTPQQKLLYRQQYDDAMMNALAFDGMTEPPTLLTLGYRLTLDESEISQVVVRRDLKGHPPWEYKIFGEMAGAIEEPTPFPNMPKPAPARLTSKRPAKKVEETEGDSPS